MTNTNNMVIFNSNLTISNSRTGNMYRTDQHFGMESTAAGVATLHFKSAVNHVDAPDFVALTVLATGGDDADRINRVAAMDAMVSKLNTVNKKGFIVAFSEIENVKPGGILSMAITLDS